MTIRMIGIDGAERELEEFARRPLRRHIRFVDTHHTYRPHKGQWYGRMTVDGMARYHRSLGWSDIGQHWTVGPDGSIWSGRDLNAIPCSQTGFNTGALMYEMVGNFCAAGEPGSAPPYDTLEGAQLDAAVALSAAVVSLFHLPLSGVRFHRQLHLPGRPRPKSCPGDSVHYDVFAGLVERRCRDRFGFDPPGGYEFVAQHVHDPGDMEGSGEPEPEKLVAFLETGGSAIA